MLIFRYTNKKKYTQIDTEHYTRSSYKDTELFKFYGIQTEGNDP